MTNRKAIIPIAVAALVTATAGPALAKKQTSEQVTAAEQQAKKKAKRQAGEDCILTAAPFMRNPRFMNRGFFKKKCKTDE
ncbi:hypothetical protein AUC71_08070 [Methyloceanibacter marginalis]|uniref:PsiF repeat-containing protein n=1 Tax=Methyloceanibacter marginalis TaxID=1774971 RepID=A0A1E3WD26_9HYPH|nr:hypothetical protein [Methyloceanibacter marginalis]ODS03719.1 hypothetical protein AUC71_08070 [Methyloceanibacter marginalis]